MAEENREAPPPRGSVVRTTSVVLVLAALAGTSALFVREHRANARQVEQLQRELDRGPVVRVARVRLAPAEHMVSLPAEVRADRRAVLYAKVSGYVKRVLVDRGDRVKEGQQLAVLESPDLEAQVAAAQAEVTLRRQQLQRALRLAGKSISENEREQAEEAVKVAQSALDRARVQKGYDTLRAPFDGTVVARYADPGTLLPAATGSTTSAQPLLEIAQLDRLRVALQLGQDDAARIRTGDPVSLQIDPSKPPLVARVSRIAQSLDARTRTMLCEIDLPSPPAGLYPGAFVQASITLRGDPRPLVPAEALVAQGGQIYVATVQDGHVKLQRVRVGNDDGATVEVLEGLHGGEYVALNLGTDVADGSPVRVQEPPAARAP
ncbi:MAG: efflux RND transporter periplasmic adaptor subunit [Myxococcales bacterium]